MRRSPACCTSPSRTSSSPRACGASWFPRDDRHQAGGDSSCGMAAGPGSDVPRHRITTRHRYGHQVGTAAAKPAAMRNLLVALLVTLASAASAAADEECVKSSDSAFRDLAARARAPRRLGDRRAAQLDLAEVET